jgi:V-type H+-transporting ATPase subunit D
MSQKEQIIPTRMNLALLKDRQASAVKGHSLLKKKVDALTMRFRAVQHQIFAAKQEAVQKLSAASLALAQAQYAAGSLFSLATQQAASASVHIVEHTENVAGVLLPDFSISTRDDDSMALVGLIRGGDAVQAARKQYTAALQHLVKLATLQSAYLALDEVLRVTTRRVNALEHVLIPDLDESTRYIASELDEISREDFFRMKKTLDSINRKKSAAAAAAASAASTPSAVSTSGTSPVAAPSAVGAEPEGRDEPSDAAGFEADDDDDEIVF